VLAISKAPLRFILLVLVLAGTLQVCGGEKVILCQGDLAHDQSRVVLHLDLCHGITHQAQLISVMNQAASCSEGVLRLQNPIANRMEGADKRLVSVPIQPLLES